MVYKVVLTERQAEELLKLDGERWTDDPDKYSVCFHYDQYVVDVFGLLFPELGVYGHVVW